MNDYHYGVNVLSLLNELAAHDTNDIHGGDFEVEGESPSGASGLATVDIPTLAEDAAKMIVELQQKLDALAADIALNGWVACSPEWIDKNGPCSCEAAPRIAFGNIGPHYHPQSFTPATDAYLNSVRAEGVAMFAEELGSPYGDYDNRDYETGFNRAIEVSKNKAIKFANQLRSGTHDTADKEAK